MDDFQIITQKIRHKAIGAYHHYGYRNPKTKDQKITETGEEIKSLMESGDWIRTSAIRKICEQSKAAFDSVAGEIGISQSSSGRWCCIPNEQTPESAPDEKEPA